MASILLPPAIAAKGFVDTAIVTNTSATLAASGYGGAITPAVTALASATTSITAIQTALTPIGETTPPAKIWVNITGAILAQIVTVNATIVATTTQSVASAGAPSPTFPASAALVDTQLKAILSAIQTQLITPQQF